MSETGPDLLYSDVEEALRSSVRALLADRSPASAVLAGVEADADADGNTTGLDSAVWTGLADLGATGLPIPEGSGGAGVTFREAAVVAEEVGRAITPVPFLGSSVLATSVLLALGETDELRALASGTATITLAVPLATAPDSAFPESVCVASDGTLSGTVRGVADARAADALLVPATGTDGPGVYLVAAADARRRAVVSLDLTRPLTDIELDAASARPLASGARAERALRRALLNGAALLSAEQLGVAEWALATTVDYLRTRTQFGRAVGSFQALKHRLADLWVGVSQARAVVRNAASAAAGDPTTGPGGEEELAAALAQAFVSGLAVRATEEAVQMHGGIGFTWEHPLHLYLKRAKSDAIALGTPDRHRLAMARLADLPLPVG